MNTDTVIALAIVASGTAIVVALALGLKHLIKWHATKVAEFDLHVLAERRERKVLAERREREEWDRRGDAGRPRRLG